jgi:hypothetical protein
MRYFIERITAAELVINFETESFVTVLRNPVADLMLSQMNSVGTVTFSFFKTEN